MAIMSDSMKERARELGRLLGQTDEYKAVQEARKRVDDDRDMVEILNSLGKLEEEITRALQRGQQPADDVREQYEALASKLQGHTAYQGLVAAQSNFEKLMGQVNEEIGQGITSGAQSRIILPS